MMTFHMLQITELYRNIFRFFADKETSFYEADALDASNPNFMLLLLGGGGCLRADKYCHRG